MAKSALFSCLTAGFLASAALVVLNLSSCSQDAASIREDSGARGTRSYKLDPEAEGIQLAIYGVHMGTPDVQKFQFLMRALKSAGEFVEVVEKQPGIEGGITICGVFSVSANRSEIYELMRSIETDAKSTNFSANSVEGCTN